ncbi:MAG: hypothetical protein ABL977_00600 [Candidatus Eisenbacteria bacterium]
MLHRRKQAALVLLAAAMFAVVPPAARAAEPEAGGVTAEGWKKVVAYAGCAFAVFRALTPADWATAALTCTKLYLDEPGAPAGGA